MQACLKIYCIYIYRYLESSKNLLVESQLNFLTIIKIVTPLAGLKITVSK